ncbi:MAG: DUF115 domain-containing protein [Lachnospiraceae bacterium]|nr:DUF115 domain-containing protein [Lachnospiraceae bacterium]
METEEILFAMVPGFGDGSFVRNLRGALPVGAVLFVWEPDISTFLYVCSLVNVSDIFLNEGISIVLGRTDEGGPDPEAELRKHIAYQNIYHASIIPMPGFEDGYPDETAQLYSGFKKAIFELTTDSASRVYFGQHNLECELLALSQLNDNYSVLDLMDRIPTRDIPVIIVAAGPSLSKNVKELKAVGDKALLVVVSRAAEMVVENGVRPHLTAVADSLVGEEYLAFDKNRELLLLMNTKGEMNQQKSYSGKLIYESVNPALFPVSRYTRLVYNYPNGGSVATNAFGLFVTAGFKTVILVGQDLAYSNEGFSHINGEREESSSDQLVEGIDGQMIETRGDWMFFLKNNEQIISMCPETTVIDATEGGALIHGSKVMKLKDAVEIYCRTEYPVGKWLSDIPVGTEEEKREIGEIVRRHYEGCTLMRTLLDESVRLNRVIVKLYSEGMLGDPAHADKCARYDELYREILTGDRAPLLMEYCDDQLQLYLKHAMVLEADSDLKKKLDFECSLFANMQERNEGLMDYLKKLFPEESFA